MIWGIPADAVKRAAPIIEPFLASVADRSFGRWTVDELMQRIRTQKMQVWVADDWRAIALTTVGREAVTIDAVVGQDRDAWADEGMATIEAWARDLGKKYVVSMARPGWSRAMRAQGFKEAHREMVKEI